MAILFHGLGRQRREACPSLLLTSVRPPLAAVIRALDYRGPPTQLGPHAAKAALAHAGAHAEAVDTVVIGNMQQTSHDSAYLARHIGLDAGCRTEVPALTRGYPALNREASAMVAVMLAFSNVPSGIAVLESVRDVSVETRNF